MKTLLAITVALFVVGVASAEDRFVPIPPIAATADHGSPDDLVCGKGGSVQGKGGARGERPGVVPIPKAGTAGGTWPPGTSRQPQLVPTQRPSQGGAWQGSAPRGSGAVIIPGGVKQARPVGAGGGCGS